MLKLKFQHKGHIHILPLVDSYEEFCRTVRTLYPHLAAEQFCYLDEEGDQIVLANQTDFLAIRSFPKTYKLSLLHEPPPRFQGRSSDKQRKADVSSDERFVKRREKIERLTEDKVLKLMPTLVEIAKTMLGLNEERKVKDSKQGPKHDGVVCDGCQRRDFKGARYKCAVCQNFDFCQQCEKEIMHPHCLLKIKTPEQAPSFIVVGTSEVEMQVVQSVRPWKFSPFKHARRQ